MMQTFHGTLQGPRREDLPLDITFQVDDGRVRMWSARNRIGSWNAEDVTIRRETIFRFLLTIEGDVYSFNPQDPSGFADSVDVVVDLTNNRGSRFGLAERLRKVAEAG